MVRSESYLPLRLQLEVTPTRQLETEPELRRLQLPEDGQHDNQEAHEDQERYGDRHG